MTTPTLPPRRALTIWLTLGTLVALTATSRAQTNATLVRSPTPTQGLYLPGSGVAGDVDATSVETNPGQLGLIEMSSSALAVDAWKAGTEREGRGFGLLLASPLLLGGMSVGGGLQWLRPSLPGEPNGYTKMSLGGGLRLGSALGFGAMWEHLFRSRYGGIDSLSVGLGWHLLDEVAAGLVLRDAFRPHVTDGGPRLPRELDGEIAVRPTGSPRLELAAGLRAVLAGDDRRWLPYGRATVGLMTGLSVFGAFEVPRARQAYVDGSGVMHDPTDFRASLGLVADLDRSSLSAAAVGSWHDDDAGDDGGRAPGVSVVLRSFYNRRPPLVEARAVARVKLSGLESDRAFIQALLALRRLGDDPGVGAVLLVIGDLDLGYGRIEELRTVIAALGTRKPVFAWLAQPQTAEYYLATACSQVAIHPAGALFVSGLSQTVTFFKTALDHLGVAVDLIRISEFKGAMEPFVLPEQSPPVRENRNTMLDDLYGRLVSGIAAARAGRGITPARLRGLIDRGVFTAAAAKDAGLVDLIADEHEMDQVVERTTGLSLRHADFGRRETGRWRPKRVAIILVDGAITDGKPQGFPPVQGTVAWSDSIIEALSQVRKDPGVRAVVLRVNSPGGSAYASDRMAREIRRVREAGKPVIVSMGDTAASGGYYVAAPGDQIIASPSVVTGSIGIYAFKVDVSKLADTLGINSETTKRGARADLFSLFRPWQPDERQMMAELMSNFYGQFLKTVADGRAARGITEARANELGRGRVYTGAQALALGLVDRLGDVGTAIDEAARRGGVPLGAGNLPELEVLPQAPDDPLQTLLALRHLASSEAEAEPGDSPAALPLLSGSALTALVARQGRSMARLVWPILMGPGSGIEARLPYDLEIK